MDLVGRLTTLLERDAELDAIERAATRAADGEGSVLVFDGAAGLGKTALLDHAAELLDRECCVVRRAAPGPLERGFGYGVVRTLLERPLRADPERLLAGVAAPAGDLLLHGREPRSAPALAHAVTWLCAALAEDRPLALLVDDAQWADRASLEVLCHLARRIEELPVIVVVAARIADPDGPSDLLALLSTRIRHLRPLSQAGAATLIARSAPAATAAACRELHTAAAGNPWLLDELARALGGGPEAGASAAARATVRHRLAALESGQRAVAAALAVLGDGAAPHVVAALAGVAPADLPRAFDALRAAGVVVPGDERLAHPLVRAAIAEDLPSAERERLHGDAARLLLAADAPIGVVAGHLLRCGPRADPEITAALSRAADFAARRGQPRAAVTYLERALRERAPGDDRTRLLVALSDAAFDAGRADAPRRLHAALRHTRDLAARTDILTRLAALQVVDVAQDGLMTLLDIELEHEPDARRFAALEVASLDALTMLPERHHERAVRVEAIDGAAVQSPVLANAVGAHRAWLAAELGAPDAAAAAQLAVDALADGTLLGDVTTRAAYILALRTLILTDRQAEARAAIDALSARAKERGSLRLRSAAAAFSGELCLRAGYPAKAEHCARLALDLAEDELNLFSGAALAVLVDALAERGAFAEARRVLDARDLAGDLPEVYWAVRIRHARAQLALAEGDFEAAYADAMATGAQREAQGRPNPSWTAWRSTAALALAHLGRRGEAVALADEEIGLAEGFGAPVPLVAALHARAVAERDDRAAVALCRRALDLASGTTAVLATVRVQLALGRALLRLGKPLEAREVLRPALADADAVGAAPLAESARRKLVATGLRPRRAAIAGPAALTARQREVGALAAAGKSNETIAQELFLSLKTVEAHLTTVYRTLGVSGRAELAAALR